MFVREYQKRLADLNVDLEKARHEGFVPKHLVENSVTTKKKLLAVVGIMTMFGRKNNRDAIRKAWMPTGTPFLHVVFSVNTSRCELLKHVCAYKIYFSL